MPMMLCPPGDFYRARRLWSAGGLCRRFLCPLGLLSFRGRRDRLRRSLWSAAIHCRFGNFLPPFRLVKRGREEKYPKRQPVAALQRFAHPGAHEGGNRGERKESGGKGRR